MEIKRKNLKKADLVLEALQNHRATVEAQFNERMQKPCMTDDAEQMYTENLSMLDELISEAEEVHKIYLKIY